MATHSHGNVLKQDQIQQLKQSVLGEVTCVLNKASGADIDEERALLAARSICEILFYHPEARQSDIPKMFWETPLGRAVGACCGNQMDEPRIKTTLRLPLSLRERLRIEADERGKSLTDLITEKLGR